MSRVMCAVAEKPIEENHYHCVDCSAGNSRTYYVFGSGRSSEPEIKYITVPIEKGTLKAEINSTGTIKPRVEVQVGSQVSGTIKKLFADFESVVKEGELIALMP